MRQVLNKKKKKKRLNLSELTEKNTRNNDSNQLLCTLIYVIAHISYDMRVCVSDVAFMVHAFFFGCDNESTENQLQRYEWKFLYVWKL